MFYRTNVGYYPLFGLLNLFDWEFWIFTSISACVFFAILVVGSKFDIVHSGIAVTKSFFCQSFEESYLLKNCQVSTFMSVQFFLLSLLGAIVFWGFSGTLTSILISKESGPPIQSLDELTLKKEFKAEWPDVVKLAKFWLFLGSNGETFWAIFNIFLLFLDILKHFWATFDYFQYFLLLLTISD